MHDTRGHIPSFSPKSGAVTDSPKEGTMHDTRGHIPSFSPKSGAVTDSPKERKC